MLRNLKLKTKLIIVQITTAFISLALCSVVFVLNEINVLKKSKARNLSTTAQIIGTSNIVALLTSNKEDVQRSLALLKVQSSILNAAFYENNGNLFESYIKSGEQKFDLPASISFSDDAIYDKEGRFFARFAFDIQQKGSAHEKLMSSRTAYAYSKDDLKVFYAIFNGKNFIGWVGLRSNIREVNTAIEQYIIIVAMVLLIGLLISIFISSLMQKAISNPISDLLYTIKNISDTADYSMEVKDEGKDELAALSAEFNKMLRIVRVRDNIITTAKGELEKKVEERTKELKKANIELEERAKILQKQNQELKEFTYVISHDLKSPLRAISSLSEWIQEDVKEKISGETLKNFDLMRGRVGRMQTLIEALVEYASAEHIANELTKVEVTPLVREISRILNPPSNVIIQVQTGMPVLKTDKNKLGKIFTILIQNAIKFHNKRICNIAISCKDKGDFYEFTVEDDGPGIAKEFHEKIFVIFQTLHTRDHLETSGAGLAIAKKIVKHWGGDIWLESELGKGSKFHFTWPKNYIPSIKQF